MDQEREYGMLAFVRPDGTQVALSRLAAGPVVVVFLRHLA